ncbi:hypothetical protein GCM10025881_37000 [Pseudolysinimonas kribbensis]|uniref:Uncharacterized protein n=1 Tax=Pseudolysinimonas kribbensis TaxID=433641 RepID=A0ABQ6KF84_9MICO|nr:hypothetical protein GCM10025881_37000 [Pseudolysinimonas kribbensis]
MTGRGTADGMRGAITLRVRQSSLMAARLLVPLRLRGSCGATGPKSRAGRMPSHGTTGCGARRRRSPIGGAAYGMPRHIRRPRRTAPSMRPPETSSWSASATAPRYDGAVSGR